VAFVLGTSLATISLFFAMSSQLGYKVTSYMKNQPDVFLKGMHIAFILAFGLALISWILGFYRLVARRRAL